MIGVRFQLTRKRLFSLIPSFVSFSDPTGGRLQVCLAVRPVANFPAAHLAQRQRRFQSVKMQIRSELQDASGESGSQGDRTNFQREKSMGHEVRCCDGIAKRPKKVITVRELGVGVDIVTS